MNPTASDRRPRAVVVEDEPLIRMTAADILEDAGFRPVEAGDADQALALLREHHASVTLLFTDVHMPASASDGFALARETARIWPHIGIIIASGRVRPGPGDMPEGAHFVGKPFSAEIVLDCLERLLPDGRGPAPSEG